MHILPVLSFILIFLSSSVWMACNDTQAVYRIPGDVYVYGVYDGHSGENCSTPVPLGLQQMAASLALVNTLQEINIIPGVRLGISLFEGCSNPETRQRSVARAAVEGECEGNEYLGILAGKEVYHSSMELAKALSLPLVRASSGTTHYSVLIKVSVALLASLDWLSIDLVLARDNLLLDAFLESAADSLLCVKRKALISDEEELEMKGIVVVLADGIDFENQFGQRSSKIPGETQLLFIPLDGQLMTTSDVFPKETYILLPENMKNCYDLIQGANITDGNSTGNKGAEVVNTILTSVYLHAASDILQMVEHFKTSVATQCPESVEGETLCNDFHFQPKLVNYPLVNMEDMKKVIRTLRMESEELQLFKAVKRSESDESGYTSIGTYALDQNEWFILVVDSGNFTEMDFCRSDLMDNGTGVDCSDCVNFRELYRKKLDTISEWDSFVSIVEWKSETWVAVVLTVSAVGVISSLAVATFISTRICKGDILEGNPAFTFLLILSVILTYVSCLPFSFTINSNDSDYLKLFCTLKLCGTSVSYSLIFSIMLARSLMIASCDRDGGFMSHVNGYLQSAMFFFIAVVQVALCVQFGALNWEYLTAEECVSMTEGLHFILTLAYDVLLLVLLVLTAPLVARSKRNYREGAFFAAAAILCLAAWCVWVVAFLLLPGNLRDAAAAAGLCSTATVIVITVLIPRTYLMMTGIVRDRLASSLPSLAYAASGSVIDINYRSTQALYDSVNPSLGSKGLLNPNFYSDRPGTPSTSKMDSVQRPAYQATTVDSTYERYDTPTSPLNVTRF